MIELLIGGIILFAVCVGATMLYDKYKSIEKQSKPAHLKSKSKPVAAAPTRRRTLKEDQETVRELMAKLESLKKKYEE